ncbi:kinesin-like protein KIF14 isoform X2 [Vicugna pacos]|uniref:Kinesin-like protein KIF14 isoform X2 n=1 Tax=Vicugna pacos TaxID=30538 RepID=A0ABM5C8C2_VICPA
MSVHTVCDRSSGGDLGLPATPGRLALSILARSRQLQPESETSAPEDGAALLRPAGKAGGIDSTYVISACEKPEGAPLPPHPAGRLTLQRRVTRSKDSSLLGGERGGAAEKTAEPRLMPRRRAEAAAAEKQETTESNHSSPETSINWKVVNHDKTFFVAPSVPPAADPKDADVQAAEKYQGTFPARSGAGEGVALGSSSDRAPVGSRGQTEAVRSGCSATRPAQSKLDVRASETGNLHLRGAGKDVAKLSNKYESLEKRTPSKSLTEHRWTPKRGLPQLKSPAASVPRSRVPSLQVKQMPKSSLLANKRERLQESTFLLEEEPALRKTSAETDPLKVENSQVTVAVRVRPFSSRMMGFSEEPGIIPRFCEDLFAQVAKKQTQEVSYHLEMSFFEVYNEKIHDLLICENGQRKQTLRVREHPTSGPYVEGLSTNVVSSYSDVQVWLELGNKKKATAATGMNDKSSRSHSVLTLVMTQTKTEFVEGEELDHRVRSRVNLVDLAGSERCPMTQTSGERLKEGVSINKSLLTLGKVISALSERAHGRRVFVPYRESVLTWLLKESLSGNSKTAMVATVSPAASSVEETLGALRYAAQARAIVNVARVNEDVSARLIRELKAEIEKLKAAQRSSQNIDPERYRLCRQEITSLRMKLHQQERDMADMQRMWKEKFEQAEKRKLQVTKELQKAGITFQMDNHLPNLVNLNEDPQLSEILLYMLKEGTTTVGKHRPSSGHDIQLAGVLIAEDHCTIRNVDGTVSITPVGEAKTYVNGKLILEPTVLHHGDRVILGGDHYFRFNHPGGVQKGDRPSGRDTLMSEGAKDFEFAKNDLLAAQRGQLEAEIKEAQLKAKEEMMQGIQIVKEMAQQELSSQKAAYESRISALEAELKEESQRKRMQEINNQKATHKIEELEKAKQRFEQEAHASRKRLEMEALATKQALEDHRIRHAKILDALETEKQRIAKEVQILQQNQSSRDKPLTIQPNWGSMKLSLMIQEANAVSKKLEKNYVFGRHVVPDKGGGSDTCVQVRNLQLGVSTVWSLEKFESKLAAMKELYESYGSNRSEDVFCDPADEWEPDITDVPVSSFSRRRSRSLMKNRRVSGCLLDIAACSAQDARPSRSSGLAGKSSTVYPGSAESPLPGVCRELIGSSLELLGHSYDEENTVADSLISNLLRICEGILAISKAHKEQDEDSQCDVFSDGATQSLTVRVASAFEQLVVLTRLWLRGELPGGSSAALPDELRQEVERLGGCLQLFLQGCSSDISSMVKEAQKQVTQTVLRAVKCVGQLAALRGTELHPPENSDRRAAGGQDDFMDALCDGVGSGLEHLLDSGLEKAEELARELLRQDTPSEVTKQMKASAVGLIGSLEHLFAEWKTKSFRTQEENPEYQDLKKMVNLAPEFLKLKRGLEQTIQMTVSAMRGCRGDVSLLKNCIESLCSSARAVQARGPASAQSSAGSGARGDHGALGSLATSLLLCFESEERPDLLEPWDACNQGPGAEG